MMIKVLLFLTLLDPSGEVQETASFTFDSLAVCRATMPVVARAYLEIGIESEVDCKETAEEDLQELLPTEPVPMIKSATFNL